MKRSDIIIALLALLMVAWIVWMLGNPKPSSPPQPSAQVATATPAPATSPLITPAPTTSPTSIPASMRQQPGGPYQPADPRWAERRRLRKEDPKYEWKTPIEFYGKVLDQDGNPVAGATADVVWTNMTPNGSSHMQVTSDADGLFSITGISGKHMTVQATKDGYYRETSKGRSSYEYAGFWEPTYHEPDPNNPVIFHLRRKGVSEPMIQRGPMLLGARNDGTPANFDLTTGRKAADSSGNIALRISKGSKINKRFDWTATVEGIDGAGLIESKDEFMATAPADGYLPHWTFSQKATDETYQSEVQAKFYVKTGDGKYARVEMRIIPEYNETAAVDLTVYLNPAPGSRNLEFDPTKVVQSP